MTNVIVLHIGNRSYCCNRVRNDAVSPGDYRPSLVGLEETKSMVEPRVFATSGESGGMLFYHFRSITCFIAIISRRFSQQ